MSIIVRGGDNRDHKDGPYSTERHYRDVLTGRLNRYANEVLRDNPRAYWRLNDALGSVTIADSSGNSRNLATVGTVLFQSDSPTGATGATTFGTAINGGTSSSHLGISGTGAFTVELWTRCRTVSASGGNLYGQRDPGAASNVQGAVGISFDPSGKIRFSFGDETGANNFVHLTTALYNDGFWHHAVFVRSSTGIVKIYVDKNLLFTSASAVNFPIANYITSTIGYGKRDNNAFYVGSVSDVAIYDTELSLQRIQAHNNASSTRTTRANALTAAILADSPYAYLRGDSGIAGEIDAGVSGQSVAYTPSALGGQAGGGVLGSKSILINGVNTDSMNFATNVNRGKNTFTIEAWCVPNVAISGIGSFNGSNGAAFLNVGYNTTTTPSLNVGASLSDAILGFGVGTNGINVLQHNPGVNFTCPLSYAVTISSLTHIVIRCINKIVEIWVNGVMVAQGSTAITGNNVFTPVGFSSTVGAYSGFLSNVALYNFALSSAQINAHKTAGGL